MKKLILALFLVIFLTSSILAADVAYVVKSGADSVLTNELNYANLTYDVIYDSNIPSTNFSKYRMILVGDENFNNFKSIPVAKHNALIINSYHFYQKGTLIVDYQWGWSSGKGSTSSPTTIRFNTINTTIINNLPESFKAYTIQDPDLKTYYLTGKKATGAKLIMRIDGHISSDSVLALGYPGTKYLNGETEKARSLFFGIVKPQYWTAESKQLFRNSLQWVLIGEDNDKDGFYTGEDCDDYNPGVNPNAKEIAYDGIDQNCNDYDLADVDGDGYCKKEYTIRNASLQCILERGLLGTDCDDNSLKISPGSSNLSLNCINNAPIISSIPNFIIKESQTVLVSISASDPENDNLTYSINNSKFIRLNNNTFQWQTNFYDAGNHTFLAIVSDGQLNATKIFKVEVREKNQAPVLNKTIPNQIWNEDTNFSLNLLEYIHEIDSADNLTFGISNAPKDTNINIEFLAGGIANFIVKRDWNGVEWVVFFAYDGEAMIESNKVILTVLPVNDAPVLANLIPNQTWNEDTSFILNLSGYFLDVDSSLSYSAIGNSQIKVNITGDIATFNPAKDWNGKETIRINASDGGLNVLSNEFALTVLPVNDAPVLANPIPNQIWNEDTNLSLNLSQYFYEPDSADNLTFGVSNTSNETNIHVELISGGIANFIVKRDWSGFDWIVFFAHDGVNKVESNNVTLTVLPVNDAPVLANPIPNQTWNEDTVLILNLSNYFKDVDSKLNYAITGNSQINVNFTGNIAMFTPAKDWNGEETIQINASDGEFNILSNEFALTVLPVNDAPVLDFINDELVLAGGFIEITPTATDIEGDSLNFTFSSPVNQSGQWQTSEQDAGVYRITATVSDGNGGSNSRQFNLQVLKKFHINEFVSNPINGSEWVELYNDFNQTINLSNCIVKDGADNIFKLNGTLGKKEFAIVEMNNKLNNLGDMLRLYCSDKLIDTVTYGNWYDGNLSDNAEAPEPGESASRNPDGLDTGNNFEDFKIFKYPTKGLPSDTDLVVPVVELLNPFDNELVTGTRTVRFEFIVTDNMAGTLKCDIYMNGGLKATDNNIVNNTIEDILVNNILDGAYNWNVKCYDSRNYAFALNSKILNVNGPDNPIFNPIGKKFVNENETLEFIISATDQDLDNMSFRVQNAPQGANLVDNFDGTAMFSWTPTYEQAGEYKVTFIVRDSTGLENQETVDISVKNKKIPPKFEDIDKCESRNSSLEITITNPDNNDEFGIGETINVKSKIKNNYSEDLKLDLRAYLYNIDEEQIVEEGKKNNIDINKGKSKNVEIMLTIPEDLKDDKFAIFVLAEGENEEILCNEQFVYVDIQRKEHEVIIKDISISRESVLPGKSFDVTLEIQNTGSEDENVYVEIKNAKLGILEKSEKFELEGYGNHDQETRIFTIQMPLNATEGNYTLEIKVIADETEDSRTGAIYVLKPEEITGKSIIYKLEDKKEASQQDGGIVYITLSLFLLILVAVLVMILAFKKNKGD